MKNYLELAKKVRLLIGKGNINEVIRFLHDEEIAYVEESLRVIEGRFNRVQKAQRNGTIDDNSANIELNRISESFLELARDIEKIKPEKQLVKSASKKTKNSFKFIYIIGGSILLLGLLGYFFSHYNTIQNYESELNRLEQETENNYEIRDLRNALLYCDSSIIFATKLKDKPRETELGRLKIEIENQVLKYDSLKTLAGILFEGQSFLEAKEIYQEIKNDIASESSTIQKNIDDCDESISKLHENLIKKADDLYKKRKCSEAKSVYLQANDLFISNDVKNKISKCEKCIKNSNPTEIKAFENIYISTIISGRKKYIKTNSANGGENLYLADFDGRNSFQEYLPRRYNEPHRGRPFDEYTFSSGLKDFRVLGIRKKVIGELVTINVWDHGNYLYRWKFVPVEGKGFYIKNSVTGFYLGINNENQLITVREDLANIWRLENYYDLKF